jgi:hypothetical protein
MAYGLKALVDQRIAAGEALPSDAPEPEPVVEAETTEPAAAVDEAETTAAEPAEGEATEAAAEPAEPVVEAEAEPEAPAEA